jgi:hypothetical protein
MDSTTLLGLAFLAVSAVIILVALALNPRLRAGIRIGPAEMKIDTSRPGWKRVQPQQPSAGGAGNSPNPASASSCQAWLVAKAPGKADWRYCLDRRPQVTIGRHPSNDIVLLDETADSKHAVIYRAEERYRINNLSQRGTLVNERSISWQNLGNGNKIKLGRTELIFRQDAQRR